MPTRQFPNLSGKTFLLGVGAQKACTSWLYRYLVQSTQVASVDIKEFHFFDALFTPEMVSDPHSFARG